MNKQFDREGMASDNHGSHLPQREERRCLARTQYWNTGRWQSRKAHVQERLNVVQQRFEELRDQEGAVKSWAPVGEIPMAGAIHGEFVVKADITRQLIA